MYCLRELNEYKEKNENKKNSTVKHCWIGDDYKRPWDHWWTNWKNILVQQEENGLVCWQIKKNYTV